MLTIIENPKQTILPAMRSNIDGWQLDGVNDWELEAIFEDMPDYETEATTQGLVNETEAERNQREKLIREELAIMYAWRVENGFDMWTGDSLDYLGDSGPQKEDNDEESDSQE